MVLLLLVFLWDVLVVLGEVRLLVGVMSSITISLEWLVLWWRVWGLVDPVMVLGGNCKHMNFEYTIKKYARIFLVSMLCKFSNRIIRSIWIKCLICVAKSLEVKACALPEAYILWACIGLLLLLKVLVL